ncbi:hypothetical protein A3B61_00600 [Candidatus Peribacteria bacterium RIFCSPLOWO2_01_FULL_53_10]|nr:MAG: hypothetical protein A3B61_00600 [Candidatus Peribacteria bacterium RIFCSPLOWO2_01_FULL_53_10]
MHTAILPEAQQRLWRHLTEEADWLQSAKWYLAGGTGLALQLGHRLSVDFDFFSANPGVQGIADHLRKMGALTLMSEDSHTLYCTVDGVKMSFIANYPPPLLHAPLQEGHVDIASVWDIALMKLIAVVQRAALRDYIDLAQILRGEIRLGALLDAGPQKYGDRWNPMIVLRALTTFHDLEGEIPKVLDTVLAGTWQQILREAVKKTALK